MLDHSGSSLTTVQRMDMHPCLGQQHSHSTGHRALVLMVPWRRQQGVVDNGVIVNLNALCLDEHVVQHL